MNDIMEIGLILFVIGTIITLWVINQRIGRLETNALEGKGE